jgi:hypothetical protein
VTAVAELELAGSAPTRVELAPEAPESAVGCEVPCAEDYLRAAECREQLQRAYATWRTQGARRCGLNALSLAAMAHMRAALSAQV